MQIVGDDVLVDQGASSFEGKIMAVAKNNETGDVMYKVSKFDEAPRWWKSDRGLPHGRETSILRWWYATNS